MYRVISIAVVLILALSTAASANGTNVEETVDGVVVTAGSPGSLTTTLHPGRPGTGPTIYCGWFRFMGGFGSGVIDLVGDPVSPIVGHVYAVNCWTESRDDPYPGYPIIKQYSERRGIPGKVVSTADAARFAIDHLNFERPKIELSPRGEQVVGVPTWLAVTSRLRYGRASANAGPVWATVRASLHNVTWDLGNGDRKPCAEDVSKVWDPRKGRSQSSDCTYIYTNSSGSPFNVRVTVRWRIWQRTNVNPAWHRWGTITRSSSVSVPVTQLQSAIR